jgi:hypothetical protein
MYEELVDVGIWEHFYRPRLIAAGAPDDDVNVPAWGDLRHLRNDIVHHRGTASSDNAGRCTVLSHWTVIGDPIQITPTHVAEFMRMVGLGDPRDGVPPRPPVWELLNKRMT